MGHVQEGCCSFTKPQQTFFYSCKLTLSAKPSVSQSSIQGGISRGRISASNVSLLELWSTSISKKEEQGNVFLSGLWFLNFPPLHLWHRIKKRMRAREPPGLPKWNLLLTGLWESPFCPLMPFSLPRCPSPLMLISRTLYLVVPQQLTPTWWLQNSDMTLGVVKISAYIIVMVSFLIIKFIFNWRIIALQ